MGCKCCHPLRVLVYNMNIDAESLQQQIPYYLTAEDRQTLVKELQAVASGETVNYFLSSYHDSFKDSMLQGDGWRGFQLFLFDTGERRSVRGLVLSNSCDVDPANRRDVPARVVFAPLVRLSTYQKLLIASGIKAGKIEEKIRSIKEQKVTNIFYLPAGSTLGEDYIVRFDEVQSMTMAGHAASDNREKIFTLNNTGFYMLVLKISVHFCRLQENINRSSKTT